MSRKYVFDAQFSTNGAFVGLESPGCCIGFAVEDGCLGILEDKIYRQFTVLGPVINISAEIITRGSQIKISLFNGVEFKKVHKSKHVSDQFKFIHKNCKVTNLSTQSAAYHSESQSASTLNTTSFTIRCKHPFTMKHANFVNNGDPNKIRVYRGNIENLSFSLDAAYEGFSYSTQEVANKARLLYILYLHPYSGTVFNRRINCGPNEFLLFVADKPTRMYFGMSKKTPVQ